MRGSYRLLAVILHVAEVAAMSTSHAHLLKKSARDMVKVPELDLYGPYCAPAPLPVTVANTTFPLVSYTLSSAPYTTTTSEPSRTASARLTLAPVFQRFEAAWNVWT